MVLYNDDGTVDETAIECTEGCGNHNYPGTVFCDLCGERQDFGSLAVHHVYVEKNFSVAHMDIIMKANRILDDYERQGFKLTLRQLYYQFVSSDSDFPNTDQSYKRLGSIITDARLAGLISFERIEDRGRVVDQGTHNELLDGGGIDPTVINGGIIHAYGSNARMGQGEWMVVEADESDGTFNRLPATIAIVTNIDPEHMEHWGDFDTLRDGFYDFVSNIPFYGVAVCCTDHPEVQALVGRITDRRVVTYGFNAQADVRAVNLTYKKGVAHFDIQLQAEDMVISDCTLPMPGDHNVSNALSAVAVARHLGMKRDEIKAALKGFGGVNRRFTKVGEVNGVTIIDDYGHHPVEIAAVLRAARALLAAAHFTHGQQQQGGQQQSG